jgi:hypothetical protein
MPYDLRLDPERGLLDLRYHGVVSVAQRFEAWTLAAPLLASSGVRRILIDLTGAIAAHEPLLNTRRFVDRIIREPLLLQSRTAFVAPPVHPANHLIELLAAAHHYPFARFGDRDAAVAWLLGDEPAL